MDKPFSPTAYRLQSVHTGKEFDDTGWVLDPPGEEVPSLVRAVYEKKQLEVRDNGYGFYKFADWLPVKRILKGSSAPVTYKSTGLAERLGLSDLWITFSGYWPEKGALMETCSFKETEAYSVCGRLGDSDGKTLVVASAGNTARAFARVCSENKIPLLLCMPADSLDAMWFGEPLDPCVKLIVTPEGSDYFDAIQLSNKACSLDQYFPEGGAKNVARRDGMSTTLLSAATTIGRIPDAYFQAIGSGTGAIAAWEANLRLIGDGRFGSHKMRLLLSQNCPFLPMFHAWEAGSRELLPLDDDLARKQVGTIEAKVLSNRKPPYSVRGGLFDALTDTGGTILKVTNDELRQACRMFQELEGIDIHPASAIATGSLIHAVKDGIVHRDEVIMLNITGGGEAKYKKGRRLFYLEPSFVFGLDATPAEIGEKLASL